MDKELEFFGTVLADEVLVEINKLFPEDKNNGEAFINEMTGEGKTLLIEIGFDDLRGHVYYYVTVRLPKKELAKRARARSTDPQTSHDAADSVVDLREKQMNVLKLFRGRDEHASKLLTDEDLHALYQEKYEKCSQSGPRSRRAELVAGGFLAAHDFKLRNKAGRLVTQWGCTAKGHEWLWD